jgi:four helix bundle protein
MATINDFENLQVWQLAREQCKEVSCYLVKFFNKKEFELISQIKRSSGSVMDNIAEGFEWGGNSEFIFFLGIAKGSNGELRSQFWRALDLDLISQENFSNFIEKNKTIGKRINSFILYLKNSELKGIKFKKRNES